jgi:hypothetical protein
VPRRFRVAVEIMRIGTIDAVEQLTRYLERIEIKGCRGVFAAQVIKPQARTLAEALRRLCNWCRAAGRRPGRWDCARVAQGELLCLAGRFRSPRARLRTTGPGPRRRRLGRDSGTPGAALRSGIVALALLVGLTVALAALSAAGPWLHPAGGHD